MKLLQYWINRNELHSYIANKLEAIDTHVHFPSLLATTGYFQSIHSCDINYEMYRSGFAIFAFDTSSSAQAATDPYTSPMALSGKYYKSFIVLRFKKLS